MSTTLKALEKIKTEHDRHRPRLPNANSAAVLASSSNKPALVPIGLWLRRTRWYLLMLIVVLSGLGLYTAGGPIPWERGRSGEKSASAPPSRHAADGVRHEGEQRSAGQISLSKEAAIFKGDGIRPGVSPEADTIPGVSDGALTPTSEPETPVKRWRDDRIKLQAVVWGSNPAECMAIINNHLVHQGAVVDGYTVATIEEQAVILTRDRDRWRLPLGR